MKSGGEKLTSKPLFRNILKSVVFSAISSPLVTADQFPSEPFGSSSADNAVTVVTHVCDVSSAVVHTETPPCIEESFQVLARDESIQMEASQCVNGYSLHQDSAV